MLKRTLTMFFVLLMVYAVTVVGSDKKAKQPEVATIAPDNQSETAVSPSHYSGVNFAPKMEKAAVGTATVIGTSFYDIWANSGSATMLKYYKGKSYMVFIGKPTAAAKREIDYVYYNGTTFTTAQAVIASATQETYFSGIDVWRGGAASGFAGVAAGWATAGSSYYGIESGPGAGSFSTTLVTPDRDALCLNLDSLGTVLYKDTKGRLNYKIRKSTDFGTTWANAETTVIRTTNTPGGQAIGTLDVPMVLYPNGNVGIATTITGKGILPNPVYTANTTFKDSADQIGFFKSTNKGTSWTWTTIGADGEQFTPGYYYIPQNFGQLDMAVDSANNEHVAFNGYSGALRINGTDTTGWNTIDLVYWDKTNGFKSLVNFTRNDTIITNVVIPKRSGNALGCSWPSIALSPNGKTIVVTWSQPIFTTTTVDTSMQPGGIMRYDIFYNSSWDGGATWLAAPVNLTNLAAGKSALFGSLAENLELVGTANNNVKARITYLVDLKGQAGSADSLVNIYYHEWNILKPGTAVREDVVTPNAFGLSQNYPNPFNPSTKIQYSIAANAFVTLKVYNVLGQEVASLVNGEQVAGNYSVNFDASSLANGVYVYKIQAGNFTESKKMMLLK